jgi:uncharacterized membrane protein
MPQGVMWNLALAVLPVALGYGLSWGLSKGIKQPSLKLLLGLPLVLVWLVSLPNTCYLLTEWRHLLLNPPWTRLLDAGREDSGYAMLRTARWALFFLAYSGASVLLFTLAIRPMEQWLRAAGRKPFLLAPFLFFLVSLGIYLDLFPRLSSWDLVSRPFAVFHSTRNALTNSAPALSIGVFGLLLWALYEGVDIWVDGMAARLRAVRGGGRGRAGGARKAGKKEA